MFETFAWGASIGLALGLSILSLSLTLWDRYRDADRTLRIKADYDRDLELELHRAIGRKAGEKPTCIPLRLVGADGQRGPAT